MRIGRLPLACILIAGIGCAGLTGSREPKAPPVGPATSMNPSAQNLIDYVNANAAKVDALESTDLALEVKAGNQGGGLSGAIYCQKPRNFRLRAKAVGKPMADFGSNDNEFWYWISQDNPPYLYHCNYADLERGVNLPFPFQPEFVLETLGMATLSGPPDRFKVEKKGDTFELVERATAMGKPVYKVTVFHAGRAAGTVPQITQYRLHDEKGQLVAFADIVSVRRDGSGAAVPQHLRMKWPQQKMEMEMKLDGLKTYSSPVLTQRAPELFQRSSLRDLQGFDLARGAPDGQSSALQRTGGNR